MYSYLALVYNVEPAIAEMVKLNAKDKIVREEILIPAVSKKFILLWFSLSLYLISSHFSLMSLSSCQDEAAKKVKEKMLTIEKKKKTMNKKKKEMIVIEEEDEKEEKWNNFFLKFQIFLVI